MLINLWIEKDVKGTICGLICYIPEFSIRKRETPRRYYWRYSLSRRRPQWAPSQYRSPVEPKHCAADGSSLWSLTVLMRSISYVMTRDSSISLATDIGVKNYYKFPRVTSISHFVTTPIPALTFAQFSAQRATKSVFSDVERPDRETHYSPS
jgi:hypothetical protein